MQEKNTEYQLNNEDLDKFINALKEVRPYLFVLEERIRNTPNGVIDLTIRTYRGRVTDVVWHSSERIKFDEK